MMKKVEKTIIGNEEIGILKVDSWKLFGHTFYEIEKPQQERNKSKK